MIKNLSSKLFAAVGTLLTVVALTGVGVNSIWYLYEPEVPRCLKNKE